MKFKDKRNRNSKSKIRLSDINELSMAIIIIKREKQDKLEQFIKEQDAEILSIVRGIGVSRNTIFESLKIGTDDVSVFFVACRIEDVREFMQNVAEKFALNVSGNGKGFTVDIDGYLGAKAIFID